MEKIEAGTAVKSESTLTPPLLLSTAGGDSAASSLASGSPDSAKGECSGTPGKGDEGGQDKIPGEGEDGGVGGAEAAKDERAGPSEDGDVWWRTVRVDDDTSSDEGGEVDDDTGNSDGESCSGTGSVAVASGVEVAGQLHPMKNPLILKSMFDLCPSDLLANFRLVCKQWEDLSLEPWRSSATLRFAQNFRGQVELQVGDPHLCRLHRENARVPLQEFLNYVKAAKNQCLVKPFRRFRLEGFMFPLADNNDVGIKELWELVKRDAKSMTLYRCSFGDVGVFRDVIYKECPNLRHLEMDRCRINSPALSFLELVMGPVARFFVLADKEPFAVGDFPEHPHLRSLTMEIEAEEIERFPLSWLELFSQFPSLSRLSLIVDMSEVEDGGDAFPMFELEPMLEAIQTIRKADPRKLPLKEVVFEPHLDISYERMPRRIFDLILKLNLPLDALKFCMDGVTQLKLNEVAQAAEVDGRPLQILTFYKTEYELSTWKFPFPSPLDNLGVLVMTGGVLWENMGWLRLVPNLARLEVTDEPPALESYRESSRSLAMISKARNLELADIKMLKMDCFTCNYALSGEELRRLADWFPNLTYLHMALDDKLMAIVCEQWPDLEFLKVIGDKLTDEGVTGLRAGQTEGELDKNELPPNISLLQNLKSFTYSGSEKLSEVSIFNGFLKLPHLRYLHLGKSKGLSKKAKAALKKKRNILLELY